MGAFLHTFKPSRICAAQHLTASGPAIGRHFRSFWRNEPNLASMIDAALDQADVHDGLSTVPRGADVAATTSRPPPMRPDGEAKFSQGTFKRSGWIRSLALRPMTTKLFGARICGAIDAELRWRRRGC